MLLYIVEKPSVAKALALFFNANGANYKISRDEKSGCWIDKKAGSSIVWCIGHMVTNAEPEEYDPKYKRWTLKDLPIVPDEFKKIPFANRKAQFNLILKLIAEATTIVHGGDPDREGQIIVDELLELVDTSGKEVKRILLNALDDASIEKAITSLQSNLDFKGLSYAGDVARQVDWLIGMNLSRFFTKVFQNGGYTETFPVGRVKSPVLTMIVERYLENQNFKPKKFFYPIANITYDGGLLPIQLKDVPKSDTEDEADQIMREWVALGAAKVASIDLKEHKEQVKELYSLDFLEVEANQKYGISPSKTLEIVQKLYEQKYLTYPRSDCRFLPESQFKDANEIVAAINASELLKINIPVPDSTNMPYVYNDKKVTAHHAIVPTREIPNLDELKKEELQIYTLIVEKFASIFFKPFTYNKEIITFAIGDKEATISIKNVIDYGWKSLQEIKKETVENVEDQEKVEGEEVSGTFNFTEGDTYEVSYALKDGTTKAPKLFTEGTLIRAMTNIKSENKELNAIIKTVDGLGTPATRHEIIDDLLKRGHVVLDKKNQMIPSHSSMELVKHLPEKLKRADFTAEMELKLNAISKNGRNATFEDSQEIALDSIQYIIDVMDSTDTKAIVNTEHPCPACGKGYLFEKSYKDNEGKKVYYYKCNNSDCEFSQKGKSFASRKAKPVTKKCPRCDAGFMVEKQGKFGTFWGCSNYPECNHIMKEKDMEL